MPCIKQYSPDEVFAIMLNNITLSFDSVDKISRPDHSSNIATEDHFLLCLLVCTKSINFSFLLVILPKRKSVEQFYFSFPPKTVSPHWEL